MSERSQRTPNQKKQQLRRNRVAAAVFTVAGMAAGAGVTHAAHTTSETAAINRAQPDCDFVAQPLSMVGGMREAIRDLGDSGNEAHVISGADGHIRNSKDDPNYNVNGSMGLQAGDIVRFDNVDPNVCLDAGGAIAPADATNPKIADASRE